MSDTKNRIQQNYKWTAYMKLKGQTWSRREEDVLDEFEGFVQSLRGVGVDYNVIVKVEGGVPRQLHHECTESDTGAPNTREEVGA
jgi:hypothetical protein